MQQEIICTNCPMGCHVIVTLEGDQIVSITGNTCPRGEAYARAEVTDPKRTITTTVGIIGGGVLPVKSDRAVSKRRISEFMEKIHQVYAVRPVHIGDKLIEDLDGDGANLVATQNAE
ncbi:MAG: DUF1667 domain-containing protein [Firmicutes bacterium]|nr:DUF1667 domain-containing protein [Bacillota bacterium]